MTYPKSKEKKKPKVSIVSISYNHEKFITKALESFLNQACDFDFEVIIADDKSTDGTQNIIRKYADKYPEIIKPILRKKNIGIQANLKDALMHASGEYIALCEGDDFWTDNNKLRCQVDFLDKHKNYSLCFHPVRVFFEKREQEDSIYPDQRPKLTTLELLRWNYIQTNSVMYRKQNYANLAENILPVDWYLHLYHAQFGKIGYINTVMSAYRRHEKGVWWVSTKERGLFLEKHGYRHLNLFCALLDMYGHKKDLREAILANSNAMLEDMIYSLRDKNEKLVKSVIIDFPELLMEMVVNRRDQIAYLNQQAAPKDQLITELDEQLNSLRNEHTDITTSRSYKLARLLLYPLIGVRKIIKTRK